MDLPSYILQVGDDAAAKLFDATPRAVASWRLRKRYPRPAQAHVIVERTGGAVTRDGIYGPAAAAPKRVATRTDSEAA